MQSTRNMWHYATSACGLKLLVYEASSYYYKKKNLEHVDINGALLEVTSRTLVLFAELGYLLLRGAELCFERRVSLLLFLQTLELLAQVVALLLARL